MCPHLLSHLYYCSVVGFHPQLLLIHLSENVICTTGHLLSFHIYKYTEIILCTSSDLLILWLENVGEEALCAGVIVYFQTIDKESHKVNRDMCKYLMNNVGCCYSP